MAWCLGLPRPVELSRAGRLGQEKNGPACKGPHPASAPQAPPPWLQSGREQSLDCLDTKGNSQRLEMEFVSTLDGMHSGSV